MRRQRSWLLTAVRVRARVRSCGICAGESGTGAGFLRVLRIPLPIFIPPIAPQSPSPIIWTQFQPTNNNNNPLGYNAL
jgi:hypothetical protein